MTARRAAAAVIALAAALPGPASAQGTAPAIGLPAAAPPAAGAPSMPAPLPPAAGPPQQGRPADPAMAYRRQLVTDLYNQQALEKRQRDIVADYDRRLKESLQEIIDAAKKPPDPQAAPLPGGGLPVGPGGGGPGTPQAGKGPTPEGQRAHAYEMLIYQANIAKAELQATQRRIAALRELVNRPIPAAAP